MTKATGIDQLISLMQDIFPCEDHFGKLLGYKGVEVKKGHVVISLQIEEKHLSPSGAVHGGALSALVDVTMGGALFTTLPKGSKCSTIEFKINYFSPVKLGETIFCSAKVKFQGKSHAVIESHIYRENEVRKDIAMAVGTYNIYS